VIKIDPSFELAWAATYDHQENSIGNAMAVDATGNVYVAATLANGSHSDIGLLKFTSTGQLAWVQKFQPPSPWSGPGPMPATPPSVGEAASIALSSDGIIVAGSLDMGSGPNYSLISWDLEGRYRWSRLNEMTASNDKALALAVGSNGDVLVSGISETSAGHQYTTVKYNVQTRNNPMVLDSLGMPRHKDNEVIVKFRPWLIDPALADDLDTQHGTLDKFLPGPHLDTLLAQLSLSKEDAQRIRIFKMFPTYTQADSISISRLGREVRMPILWSTFIVETIGIEPMQFCEALYEVPEVVDYAHLNIAVHAYSNDPLYMAQLQPNLTPTNTYPDAHINVEEAWLKQQGQPHIRVGVIDDGIFWDHPDFVINGVTKVGNGRSFLYANEPQEIETWMPSLSSGFPGGWHGTSCAAIIGALRNNGTGIAGIAGGDVADSLNRGVTLIPLVMSNSVASMAAAIFDGSTDILNSTIGLACHVLNLSLGFVDDGNPQYLPASLIIAIRTAYENDCSLVNAIGNYQGYMGHYSSGPSTYSRPGGYLPDASILAVGATGNNGLWWNPFNSPGNMSSNRGPELDLLAPGSAALVNVPMAGSPEINWCSPAILEYYPDYTCFWGTSAATPHISGVAALMHSQHSTLNGAINGLAPEDVEILMERSTFGLPEHDPQILYYEDSINIQYPYELYYGNGRVDAGSAVAKVSAPYCVVHSMEPDLVQEGSDESPELVHVGIHNHFDLLPGNYNAYRRQVTHTYHHQFEPTEELMDQWPRFGATIGELQSTILLGSGMSADYDFDYDPVGHYLTVTATTYALYIQGHATNPGVVVNQWYPAPPSKLRTAYSLHMQGSACWGPSFVSVEEIEEKPEIILFPNPAMDMIHVQFNRTADNEYMLEIFDVLGRNALNGKLTPAGGKASINIADLTRGTYLLRLSQHGSVINKTFIKH
jgi:subtilisin family serine protease